MKKHWHVYITTCESKTTIYVGSTNQLVQRLIEHYLNRGNSKTFAGRYHCHNLIYVEAAPNEYSARVRERQIKKWRREKKIILIQSDNPTWKFLNEDICGEWPPIGGELRDFLR